MDQEKNIPLLLSFYFGDSAPSAQGGVSRRLKKWSRAFDRWIEERQRDFQKDAVKQARMAWRRLVRQCGKMPWALNREDIEQHCAWMMQEDFAPSTINNAIGLIGSFYEWCDDRGVDSACAQGFNPAKEATRIKVRRYDGACIWTREEVGAFLDLLKRDGSILGKRDFAYFLARISLGVPLKYLQELRWEQLQVDEAGAWLRWRLDGERVRLPDEVWQAIKEYLRLSGRLEGMRAEKYIFAALATPGREFTGDKEEDWLEEQRLSGSSILSGLKLYGRKLGIAEEKLSMMALRRTAVRLRMEAGESLLGMKVFMDSREEIRATKYRLSKLPELREESEMGEGTRGLNPLLVGGQVEPPVRRAKPLKGGQNSTHGFFSRKRDQQAVKDVLKENIHGMEAEIECLRRLMRGLLDWEGDEARLAEGYSKATQRLAMLLATEVPAEKGEKNSWAEEVLERMDEVCKSHGMPPFSTGVLEEVYGSQSGDIGARGRVAEEVATCRLLLRNVYKRAMQGVGADEYVRLVDLYGMGCVRLTRLIKIGGGDGDDRLTKYLNDMLDKALRQLTIKYGFDKEN